MKPSALALTGLLATVLVAGNPAQAVGVAGVELTVVAPKGEDGRPDLVVGGQERTFEVVLRNIAGEPRAVQLGVVGANVDADGSARLTSEADGAWLGVPTQDVALGPGERMVVPVTVHPQQVPDGDTHLAFVISARQGGNVVTQAASVMRISAQPPPPPWPLWLIALALLLFVVAALARELRRRRSRLPGAPVPA